MSKIAELIEILNKAENIYIQPHNMPDPDAIASSFALLMLLKEFNIKAEIIYVSLIEKINSITMVQLLGIDMTLKQKDFISNPKDFIIMVDSQIGNSNVTNIEGQTIAVIDHHNKIDNDSYVFSDIRSDVGACSTLMGNYYKELGIIPSQNVSTALLYGIMTDTNNLTRASGALDMEIFYWLYGFANIDIIKKLRMNEIGREDIKAYAKALDTIEIYGNMGFVHIENCNDSLLGTISDMVYTIEGVNIVVSYARREDGVKFSVRCGLEDIAADGLIRHILHDKGVGGGHNEMAGGFIDIEELGFLVNKELDTYVRYKAISFVNGE